MNKKTGILASKEHSASLISQVIFINCSSTEWTASFHVQVESRSQKDRHLLVPCQLPELPCQWVGQCQVQWVPCLPMGPMPPMMGPGMFVIERCVTLEIGNPAFEKNILYVKVSKSIRWCDVGLVQGPCVSILLFLFAVESYWSLSAAPYLYIGCCHVSGMRPVANGTNGASRPPMMAQCDDL